MKHFPFSILAAVLAAAVSAPAQFTIEARLGRHVTGAVVFGDHFAPARDRCEPVRRYEPRGRWETVQERYLVPGYWREEHVPPTYGWVGPCWHRHWGVVDAGGCRSVWVPERWETRCRQVWVTC